MSAPSTEHPESTADDPADPTAENRRVAAVQALGLLDRPPDTRFERITRLAQNLFAVPLVSITLVDRDRQWRASWQGPLEQQADRAGSFCEVAMRAADTVVIDDARTDDVFAASPYVTGDPHLRFYAGHPLHSPAGEAIGTLCIMDVEPRTLDDVQRRTLAELGSWVQQELYSDGERHRAAEVQRSLLPHRVPVLPGWSLTGFCARAGGGVGGDFFDWYEVPGGFQFTVADVFGTGMASALLSATVRAGLRSTSMDDNLTVTLNRAFGLLHDDLAALSAMAAVFHGRIDTSNGALAYVDAGHGLTMITRADGSTETLGGQSRLLGADAVLSWQPAITVLGPGDTLFCYSDGLRDLLLADREMINRMKALGRAPMTAIQERILSFTLPAEAADDVTGVIIRRLAPGEAEVGGLVRVL